MKNLYTETYYIFDNYLQNLQKAKKKLQKKGTVTLNNRRYQKLAYNKALDKLFCNPIAVQEDKDILIQLQHLASITNSLKSKSAADYTKEELSATISNLITDINNLKELLEPKTKPWEKYVPLIKIGSFRFGKMKAGFVILLWFILFVLLPVIVNFICISIQ